jgi:hypothetical protein
VPTPAPSVHLLERSQTTVLPSTVVWVSEKVLTESRVRTSAVRKGCPQLATDGRRDAGHGRRSEAVRERAILALLSEPTLDRAAVRCRVSARTLRRWLVEDRDFRAEYDMARQAIFQAGLSRLQALTARAVDTLHELLNAKRYPSVRLGAARTIIEWSAHQSDAQAIVRRLDELEASQSWDLRGA